MGFLIDDEDVIILASAEEKEKAILYLWNSCPDYCFFLIEGAELHGILHDLVEKAKAIDDDKSRFILSTVNLMGELSKLLANDDVDEFSHFLATNADFVLNFPAGDLFHFLCSRRPAPKCAKLLLQSSFAVHLDVNQFASDIVETPLLYAAEHLWPSVTRILLQLGADIYNLSHLTTVYTPLEAAINKLRSQYFTSNENITGIFYKLSRTNLKDAVEVVHQLALASRIDLRKMLGLIYVFATDDDWVKLTLLLVIAQPFLLYPPIDAWFIDNTPASRFLSSIDPTQVKFIKGRQVNEAQINKARTVVTSVWEASQNLCKMHFILRLIPSSGVEEPFPEVMHDFFEQYINAHSYEAYIPWKRARNEP